MSKIETQKHIDTVRTLIEIMRDELWKRSNLHDKSKLESPEVEIFEIHTPRLKGSTYGSEEYKTILREMKVALDHHYANNRHHPEYFLSEECIICFEPQPQDPSLCCQKCGNGQFGKPAPTLKGMNLIDLLEMLCDWKAATMRHADGDILKSLEINQKRFGYSDELKQIFQNTVKKFF